MGNQKKGLGKGLNAIFSSNKINNLHPAIEESAKEIKEEISKSPIQHIDINKIVANEYQPRKIFNQENLEELSESIKKYGILQPLLVIKQDDDKYELIAGERRLRAAKLAGLEKVPVIIKEVGDLEKFELALIENIQRQDLNPIEKAESYKQLIEVFNLTQEEASKRLGVTRSSLANTLRLLSLPSEMQKALAEGKINEGQARALLALNHLEKEQKELFNKLLVEKLPVRNTENIVKKIKAKEDWKVLSDFKTQEYKEELERLLQTKVHLQWNGHKGKVVINIFSLEEVQDLINKLKNS